MSELFLKILNMSISASWVVLAVVVLRFALKKAPKWVNVLLWGMVAVRLVCPVSLESVFSLLPSAEPIPEEIIFGPGFEVQTGVAIVDKSVNNYLDDRYFEGVTVPINYGLQVMTVLSVIWLVGMAGLLIYTLFSYLRLRRKVNTAVLLRDNIFQSEAVGMPFVLGIFRPGIYLPFTIEVTDLEHVVAHEQAHIRRGDHLWKPLGFLLLTVYWFNPLLWLAYVLLCRDIELACDERVIKNLDNEQKACYSRALLTCSIGNGIHGRLISACPLAFGEVGVKERVKSVMNYKRPGFWMIVLALISCLIVMVCFLTNPKKNLLHAPEPFCHGYQVEEVLYSDPQVAFSYAEIPPCYQFTSDYGMFETENVLMDGVVVDGWAQRQGVFKEFKITSENFDYYFAIGGDGNRSDWSEFRADIDKAWKIDVENHDKSLFYYLIYTKQKEVYLACGGNLGNVTQTGLKTRIGWLFQLARTDILSVNAVSEGCNAYVEPAFYPEGFDWNYAELPSGIINSSGKLVIQTSLDVDTLVVGEDYYRDYGNSAEIERNTYELSPISSGSFELQVALRGEQKEKAYYFIRANEGVYVFKIVFGTDSAELVSSSDRKVDAEEMLTALENYYKDELPDSASSPHVLFVDATNGMIVFGQGETTLIYVTKDGGLTWEQAEIPEAGQTWHAAVTCATAISATEYCIGYRYWGVYEGAFYLTKDCGKTWTRLEPETAISKDITDNMRYAEAAGVTYENGKLVVQVSCKTMSGNPWSIEVNLESEDLGDTWKVIEILEKATDAE